MEWAGQVYQRQLRNQIYLQLTWIFAVQMAAVRTRQEWSLITLHLLSRCIWINSKCPIINCSKRAIWVRLARPRQAVMRKMAIWVRNQISLRLHKRLTVLILTPSLRLEGAMVDLTQASQICRLGQKSNHLVSIRWLGKLAIVKDLYQSAIIHRLKIVEVHQTL